MEKYELKTLTKTKRPLLQTNWRKKNTYKKAGLEKQGLDKS